MYTRFIHYDVILVDDGSKIPYAPLIKKTFPSVDVITNDKNYGFAKTVNAGIKHSTGKYICLLNNDTIIKDPMWLDKLLGSMNEYDLTAPAGGRLDDKYEYIPGEVTRKTDKFSYLAGWCLLVKRQVFDKIGLIPEDFGIGFWEDVLFCHKAKESGFKMGITENSGVVHLYHTTFKAENINIQKQYSENRQKFLKIIGVKS